MKKMFMIGTISLITISGSVSIMDSSNLNNITKIDEQNQNNSISILDGEYTLVNNLDVYNESIDQNLTQSLFYSTDTRISWDFYVYDSDGNKVEDAYLKTNIHDAGERYDTNDSVIITQKTTAEHFYLHIPGEPEEIIDLGIILPKWYLDSFKEMMDQKTLVVKNSLKVFTTETENIYDYQFKLNFNLQDYSAYIKEIPYMLNLNIDDQPTIEPLYMLKDQETGLFLDQTENYEFTTNDNSTTIRFLNLNELNSADFVIQFYNKKIFSNAFELPSIVTTKNQGDVLNDGLYAIDSFGYENKSEVEYAFDNDSNIFTLSGVDYVDQNNKPIDENVYIHLSVSFVDQNLEDSIVEIKMNYDQTNDSYFLNIKNEANIIVKNNIDLIKIDQIIISNPNTTNKITSEESVIDVMKINEVEIPVQIQAEESNTSYIWVGILGALFGLLLLILIYTYFKYRRNNRLNMNDLEEINSELNSEI